jgi:hypothetical protein
MVMDIPVRLHRGPASGIATWRPALASRYGHGARGGQPHPLPGPLRGGQATAYDRPDHIRVGFARANVPDALIVLKASPPTASPEVR